MAKDAASSQQALNGVLDETVGNYDQVTVQIKLLNEEQAEYARLLRMSARSTGASIFSIDMEKVQAGYDAVVGVWEGGDLLDVVTSLAKGIGEIFGPYSALVDAVADGVHYIGTQFAEMLTSEIEFAASMTSVELDMITMQIDSINKDLKETITSLTEALEKALEINEDRLEDDLKAIDEKLQADLEAAGVADLTKIEQLEKERQAKLDAIAAETDAADKAALEAELRETDLAIVKQGIMDAYYASVTAAEEKAAADRLALEEANIAAIAAAQASANKVLAQYEYDKAVAEKALALYNAQLAEIVALSELHWYQKEEKAKVKGIYAALYEQINGLPLPAMPAASGGIFMPSPGGTIAQLAEAGQPEVVFPLTELERFLSGGSSVSAGAGTMHLVVNMDSKPFLDTIFPATRNRTVLISAGAVV
jgi:hypothetical protein